MKTSKTSSRTAPPGPRRSTGPAYDVIIAGDFSIAAEAGSRAAGEASSLLGAGYATGLLHLPLSGASTPVAPELTAEARRENCSILTPGKVASCRLLILHLTGDEAQARALVSHIAAGKTVAVSYSSEAPARPARAKGNIAAANPQPAQPGARGSDLWPLAIARTSAPAAAEGCLRIGVIASAAIAGLAQTLLLPKDTKVDVVAWQPRSDASEHASLPSGWTLLKGTDVSIDWFMRRIDALVILVAAPASHDIIVHALSAGKLVTVPTALAPLYKAAVIACEPQWAVNAVLELDGKARAKAALVRKAQAFVERHHSPAVFLKIIEKVLGSRPRRKAAARKITVKTAPRVLFVPKGGVGIGHVTRALAVARRADGKFDPVFVSLAEQPGLIESFGFRTEYIPSPQYAGLQSDEWEPWFRNELEGLIDDYDAHAVVFDGSDPPNALVSAVASRPHCKLAWIRRGMWEPGYDPSLCLSPHFDLILEPGEVAAERDKGATALRRSEAVQVAPVTLLDRSELLSREEACRAIGFDPARPTVLLQLGSGENREVVGLIDQIIAQLELHPDVQIAIAEWANASGSLRLWKNVKVLKGAPLSLYFNAFDFSVAAAGYNTFHEAISFGLPTIFVPNTAPGMDDQQGRAQFAQDRGAAIELPQTDMAELPQVLSLMMNASFRQVMKQNAEGLFTTNGAAEASARISALVN